MIPVLRKALPTYYDTHSIYPFGSTDSRCLSRVFEYDSCIEKNNSKTYYYTSSICPLVSIDSRSFSSAYCSGDDYCVEENTSPTYYGTPSTYPFLWQQVPFECVPVWFMCSNFYCDTFSTSETLKFGVFTNESHDSSEPLSKFIPSSASASAGSSFRNRSGGGVLPPRLQPRRRRPQCTLHHRPGWQLWRRFAFHNALRRSFPPLGKSGTASRRRSLAKFLCK